jgi:hypothetical protein
MKLNETANARINVTLRSVRVTTVAMEKRQVLRVLSAFLVIGMQSACTMSL